MKKINIKWIIIIVVMSSLLGACSKDNTSDMTDEISDMNNLFEPFSCMNFLNPDALSNYCNAELFVFSDGDIARATNGCRYNMTTEEGPLFALEINVRESVARARSSVQEIEISSGPDDIAQFSRPVKDVGDTARLVGYTDVDGNTHMTLFTHLSNAMITVSSVYLIGLAAEPCTHNEEGLSRFAKEIISFL